MARYISLPRMFPLTLTSRRPKWSRVIGCWRVADQQIARDGHTVLANSFDPDKYSSSAAVPTSDGASRAVIVNGGVDPGHGSEQVHAVPGAWRGTGAENHGGLLKPLRERVEG